jgi:hypothetical protein
MENNITEIGAIEISVGETLSKFALTVQTFEPLHIPG